MKRTDFGDGAPAFEGSRRDFLRKEEDDVTRGRSEARAKSCEREGSFGWVMMSDVGVFSVPWNWE